MQASSPSLPAVFGRALVTSSIRLTICTSGSLRPDAMFEVVQPSRIDTGAEQEYLHRSKKPFSAHRIENAWRNIGAHDHQSKQNRCHITRLNNQS